MISAPGAVRRRPIRRPGSDRALVAIVVVAAAARLVWVLYAAREPTTIGDPSSYLAAACTIRWTVRHPGREAGLIPRRLRYTFAHDHEAILGMTFVPHSRARLLRTVSDRFFLALIVLSLIGSPSLLRGRDPRRLTFLAAAFVLVAVALLLYGYPRFHVPVSPFMAVVAAVPIGRLRSRG